MAPIFVQAGDATMKKTENEVATVLIHMKKLLRLKNRLCSPLLRLPTEIVVHILSFIMQNMSDPRVWRPVWRPVFCACHRIHKIMSTATELWWEVNCTQPNTACVAFRRSKGNPQVVIAELNSEPRACQQELLEYWRERQVSHGHRLHTLRLYGIPSDIAHISWIFEHSLPRLRNLTIYFSGLSNDEGGEFSLPASELALLPVTLQLPMDMPLRVLRLRNATLPWSSNLFTGLRELYLNLGDCPVPVVISEDELLRILDASSRLERLSLVQVGPRIPAGSNVRQFTRERTVRLPSLASLWLGDSPEVISYILAHIDIPAITSLQIHPRTPPQDIVGSLNLMLPDDHVQKRLVSNPPVFKIGTTEHGMVDTMSVEIGSFKMWFDFDTDDAEIISDTIVTHLQPLVPPSTTALKIDYAGLGLGELRWREFLISHPEVRSIECLNFSGESILWSMWDALSHNGTDPFPPCPKLELVSLFGDPASTNLLNCLLSRKNAGFELKNLKAEKVVDGLFGKFSHLVEALEASNPEDLLAWRIKQEVRPISWISFTWSDLFLVDRVSGYGVTRQTRRAVLMTPLL